jgi:hypothetical protein
MSQLQPDPNKTQPLAGPGVITSAVAAVLGFLVTLGLDISPETQAQIMTAAAIAAPLLVWLWGRQKVFSPATVHRLLSARGQK